MGLTRLANTLLLLLVIIVSAEPELAEVWVAVEDKLEVSTLEHNKGKEETISSTDVLDSLPAKHIIGLSHGHHFNGSPIVYATTLDARGPSVFSISKEGHKLIATTDNKTNIYFEDIALDPESQMLYLTSKTEGSILQVKADMEEEVKANKENIGLKVFVSSNASRPSGIAVDPCSRRIFWTDSSRNSPAIFSCPPGSPDCTKIIASNLNKPRAIAVDPLGRRLFWSDTFRGTFTIKSSWLDGTDPQVVVEGRGQEPFGLDVHEEHVYWTDWTTYSVWRAATDGLQKIPERMRSFSSSKPHSLAIIPAKPLKCRSKALRLTPITTTTTTTTTSSTTSSSSSSSFTIVDEGGIGFGEPTVEGACYNYCLGQNVSCYLRESQPQCECPASRRGARCEVDPCDNFCLSHSVACRVVDGSPECFCPSGWSGDRCHLRQDSNSPLPQPQDPNQDGALLLNVSVAHLEVLVLVLAATSLALLLLVVALAVVIFRLKQRPRIIRKRFISTTAPPAPTRTTCGGDEDGVRLDIEDCCNMTLCDTPCFEPPTRGPKKSTGRRSGGGCQDKRSLLSNQDDDSLDF